MVASGSLALAAVLAVLHGATNVEATWTRPQIGMGWEWRLTFTTVPDVSTPNVPVWDLDPEQLSPSDIPTLMNALHAHNRYVICYVNVGALDTGKADASQFTAVTPTIVGNVYPGWPNESFLDIRRNETRALIKARFQRMASYGCHAIEPDNLDSYTYPTFMPKLPDLVEADAIDYMNWLSTTVHDMGMAIGLKNGGDLVAKYNLAALFDFAVVESCAEYSGDCAQYNPFIQAGKPVFAVEYTTAGTGGCPIIASVASACAATNTANLEGIVKTCDVGTEYYACQTYDSNGYRTVQGAPTGPPMSPFPTPSPAPSKSPAPLPSPTSASTSSPTPIPAPTNSPTPIPAATNSPTPIPAATNSPTPLPAPTNSPTPIPAPTNSPTPIPAPTNSPTPMPMPPSPVQVTSSPTLASQGPGPAPGPAPRPTTSSRLQGRLSTKPSTWSRRFTTLNRGRQAPATLSDSSNGNVFAGLSIPVLTAAVGVVVIIGTIAACLVWTRRRDARAKQTLQYQVQLAAV